MNTSPYSSKYIKENYQTFVEMHVHYFLFFRLVKCITENLSNKILGEKSTIISKENFRFIFDVHLSIYIVNMTANVEKKDWMKKIKD